MRILELHGGPADGRVLRVEDDHVPASFWTIIRVPERIARLDPDGPEPPIKQARYVRSRRRDPYSAQWTTHDFISRVHPLPAGWERTSEHIDLTIIPFDFAEEH